LIRQARHADARARSLPPVRDTAPVRPARLAYATLRKLPATAAGSLAEEYLAIAAHQQDADIGAKTLGVDPVAHVECFTGGTRPNKAGGFIRECVVPSPPPTLRFALLIVLAVIIAGLGLVAGSTDIGIRPAFAALTGDLAEPAAPWCSNCAYRACCQPLQSRTAGARRRAAAGPVSQSSCGFLCARRVGRLGRRSVVCPAARSLVVDRAVAAALGAIVATLTVLALARGGATVRVLLTAWSSPALRRPGYAGAGPGDNGSCAA